MYCTSCGAPGVDEAAACSGCGSLPGGEAPGARAATAAFGDVGSDEVPRDGPSVATEVVRRLAFHGGLLAAVLLVVWPPGPGGERPLAIAAGIAVAAIVAYVGIPWPRHGPRVLAYSRGSSVIGPDILGFVLTAFFFVLPILVVADHSESFDVGRLLSVEYGWIWLTGVMWFMAAICATIVVVALWYATFAVHLLPGGMVRFNLLGRAEWRWADTVRAEPAHFAFPTWFRVAATLVGCLNWKLMGAILVGANAEMNGLRLVARDGRTLTLWADHMPEFPRIVQEMDAAGVPLEAGVRSDRPEWFGMEAEDEDDAG